MTPASTGAPLAIVTGAAWPIRRVSWRCIATCPMIKRPSLIDRPGSPRWADQPKRAARQTRQLNPAFRGFLNPLARTLRYSQNSKPGHKRMTAARQNTVADFSCEVRTPKKRGRRIELALTPIGGSPVEFDMAATMAERLVYRLHYLCRCGNVDALAAGADVSYPADDVRLRFDPITGAGTLSFSSRASQTIHVQLSLNGLIDLRSLLAKVK